MKSCGCLNSVKNRLNVAWANSGAYFYEPTDRKKYPRVWGVKFCPFCGRELIQGYEKQKKRNI